MFELAAQLQGLSGDTTQNQLVCKLKQSKKKAKFKSHTCTNIKDSYTRNASNSSGRSESGELTP